MLLLQIVSRHPPGVICMQAIHVCMPHSDKFSSLHYIILIYVD